MISELEIGRLEKGGAGPCFAKASQGRLAGGLNAAFRVNLKAFFLFGEY